MIGVALRGLSGRKFRTVLTAIAIVLGVAMMSGAYVLTDTIDKAFNAIFVESYAGTDGVVSGMGADITFEGEQAQTPPIPEDVLEQVRAVDGVDRDAPGVREPARAQRAPERAVGADHPHPTGRTVVQRHSNPRSNSLQTPCHP
jgi:putative ABC transport system permease protein